MGIFDDQLNLWDVYEISLQFREKVIGGIPKRPDAVEEMIRRRMGATPEDRIRDETIRTLNQLYPDKKLMQLSPEEADRVMDEIAVEMAESRGNTFNSDESGLYLGSYQLKAAFKENANIVFGGTRSWGTTSKGAMGFVAERVFFDPEKIYLLDSDGNPKTAGDGVERRDGTVSSPTGPRAICTRADFVNRPKVAVEMKVAAFAKEWLTEDRLKVIFVSMQDNGIGAMRNYGHGRFDVIGWEKVAESKGWTREKTAREKAAEVKEEKPLNVRGLKKVG